MRLQKLSDGTIRLSQLNSWEVRTFRSLPALADFSGHEAAERRLLPSPAVESDLTPEMGMDWVEYVIPELRDSFAHNLGTVMADLENLKIHQPGGGGAGKGKSSHAPEKNTGKNGLAPDYEGADSLGESQRDDQRRESGGNDRDAEHPHGDPGADDSLDDDDDFDDSENTGDSPQEPLMELYTVDIPSAHAEQWFRAMNQARLVLSARHGIDSEHLPDLASLLASGRLEHWFQYELFVSLQGWLVDAVLDAG